MYTKYTLVDINDKDIKAYNKIKNNVNIHKPK